MSPATLTRADRLRRATLALEQRLRAILADVHAAERARNLAAVLVMAADTGHRAEVWADACDMLLLRGTLPHATEADCAVALADGLLAYDRAMWGDPTEAAEALAVYGTPDQVVAVWLARRQGPALVDYARPFGCRS